MNYRTVGKVCKMGFTWNRRERLVRSLERGRRKVGKTLPVPTQLSNLSFIHFIVKRIYFSVIPGKKSFYTLYMEYLVCCNFFAHAKKWE